MIAVADPYQVCGGDVDVDAVERAARAVSAGLKAYAALRSFMWAALE